MAVTTLVRDSDIGDQWIRQAQAAVPIGPVFDATGAPTGNYLTGPVRLAFPHIFQKNKPKEAGKEGKYGATLLFPPGADLTAIYNAYSAELASQWAQYYDPATGQYPGLHSPFHDQNEKARTYTGYTPGCITFNVNSQFKPLVCDGNMNPVVDEARAYAGVWAILSVNPYSYGGKKNPQPKKGVGFGIQSVMLIADDRNLGGGPADPASQFGNVKVVPPVAQPSALFGQPVGSAAPGFPPQGAPGFVPPGFAPPGVPGFAPPAVNTDDWLS